MDLLANLDVVLEKFVTQKVVAAADQVDATGEFPKENIRAFLAAGLGGLLSSKDNGGAGGTIRDASKVVERIGRACGSTAMVVTMHYCGAQVIAILGDAIVLNARRGWVTSANNADVYVWSSRE